MTASPDHRPVPWYRQFWPWFLLALPAAAFVAGSITLAIALRHADQEISEPFTKHGLIIEPARAHAQAPERRP